MGDLASDLFKRYGLRALGAAAVAVVLIWVVAHYTAAPGGNVSVLWGLVQYTKSSVSATASVSAEPDLEDRPSAAAAPSGLVPAAASSIVVAHGLSAQSADETMDALRRNRALRELSPLESDRSLTTLPSGVYGYLLAHSILLLPDNGFRSLDSVRVQRFQIVPYAFFEVQRSSEGTLFLIAFCTETDAVSIGIEPAESDVPVVLSAQQWGQMTSLVSIPIDRLRTARPRELEVGPRETVYVLDANVR